MSYEAVKQGLTEAYMDVYGHAPTEAQIQEQMQWHADNDDPSSVKNQVMHGFKNAGIVDEYEDPHTGEEGMFGGWGATIGSVAGGIIGGVVGSVIPVVGTAAGATWGAGIGGALLGGAEEYETSHDWADTGQAAMYGGAQGAVMGYSAGLGNVIAAGAVAGGGTTLLQKAQGGSWSDAGKQGVVAGIGAGIGSKLQGGTATGTVDWSSGISGTGAGTQSAFAQRISDVDYLPAARGVTGGSSTSSSSLPMTNTLLSGSTTSTPLAQASALTTGEAASTGLFGTGYSAMELLTGTSIALQGVGTVMNYINQEDELSPEEEADRQIRYWNALAKAGYGSSVPGSDSTTPTTPGSVYKSGSITKG